MNSSRLMQQLLSLKSPAETAQGWDSIIHREVMKQLMLALQYRDPTLVRHSRQVASLAVGVAEQLGWEGRQLQILEAACLLHDVGKIGIPDIVLYKPGPLAPEEAELMTLLYRITGDVLQACRADQQVVDIITQSQYHFNGATSDFEVIGAEIHQGARILAVADAYESLVNHQAFREAYPHTQAIDILSRGGGSRFDGNVISALIRWFEFNPGTASQQTEAQQYKLSTDEMVQSGTLSHVFSYLYLLESLYHGFHIVDHNLKPLVWNAGCERLTGISWQRAREYPRMTDIIRYRNRYGEPLSPTEFPILIASDTGKALTTELQLRVTNDSWLPVEVQTIPIPDANGEFCGFAEIYRDLTNESQTGEYRDLKLMATRDALTHVANRGELHSQLNRYFREFVDSNFTTPFSVIFLDVDHFKKTNDTFGHAAGDEVLVSLARLLQQETYSGELIARFGGEEFVVLCPETKLDTAWQKSERLRNAISRARVVNSDEFQITASFGVAEIEPTDTPESVIERADKALYMSKRSGRNRSSRLTSEELKAADITQVTPPENVPDTFTFRHKLRACL
ncbi:MAG: diguanylate cyclase, partial [Planctomycetaceae bacterium]